MALIDDIISKINGLPVEPGGALTLSRTDFNIEFIDVFFSQVIGSDRLAVHGAQKTLGSGSITVAGQADFLGYQNLGVVIVFASQDDQIMISIDGSFAKTKSVQLPVVSWIEVGNIGLTTTIAQPFNIVAFKFHANVILQGDTGGGIPIEIARLDSNTWQIDAAEGIGQGITGDQLVALVSGNALTSFLPEAVVTELDGFQLNGINAVFDVEKKRVDYFSVGVKVTNGWDMAPKLSLAPGLQIILSLLSPTDADNRQIIGMVKGTININQTPVPVFVQAKAGPDPTTWMVGLDPESTGVTLPSLADLFALAGGDDFKNSLPSGLRDIPQINISKLEVGFTVSPANLQLLTFAAGTTSPWPVIDGFFTVQQLYFELDLLNLTDSANKQIGGLVMSTFSVTDSVWLYFMVQKDPVKTDWVLTGGLPPGKSLNLTDLVAKLLSDFVTLPAQIPVLSFDTVNATVIPGQSMTFAAGSQSKWVLIADQLEIDRFNLSFTYNNQAPQDKFSGSLETDLTIARVLIHIAAALDKSGASGWRFDGDTAAGQQIHIGDLISDLGQKFGVTVPKPVESFTLQDIRLHFVGGVEADQKGPREFGFGCTGKFVIANNEIDATVNIALTRQDSGSYDKDVKGTLSVHTAAGGLETLTVTFSENDQDERITVSWSASAGHELTLEDIAHAFGFKEIPELPSSLQGLGLADLRFSYDFTKQVLVIALTLAPSGAPGSANFGQAIIISAVLPDGNRAYVVGLDVHLGITLANIPLVGEKLPDAQNLGIPEAGIWILSQHLQKAVVEQINIVIDSKSYSTLPDTDITSNVLLSAQLALGGDASTPLSLALDSPPAAPGAALATPPAPADNTKWFNVQKQLGIFQFKRVGVQYQDNTLLFALDAAIELGPLAFSMDGLSMGSPLTHFAPTFNLSGLGLAYVEGPVEIAGALLKIPGAQLAPDTQFQFDGMVVIKAEQFSLAAIGSYAQQTSGDPSLFVFAQLEAPIGGPPAFFITGLMAGFGFNRTLAIPAQDEVLDFPLLLLAQPPAPGQQAAKQDPMQVLDILEGRAAVNGKTQAWISPQPGEYWLAAGLEFMSFELVRSKALLIVEFGNDFEIVLLGLSTLQLPQPEESSETYAYVQMQIKVALKPQEGCFAATAILSRNSYVITPDCHLTGGFAFYLWFGSSEHAGDFVITLGGYHPAFKPPSHFPVVPRLGFNWAVSTVVSIKGEAYFALTNSCIMAGGGLEVLFHDGDLQAWFTAHADFLVSWRPFFYLASIEVSIGVSYRLNLLCCHKTLSISLGASLDMWGPPTGGVVHIHVVVVSFTVYFGSDGAGQNQTPLEWTAFKNLLPESNTVCRITASAGLYKTQDSAADSSGKLWIVRAKDFAFFTQSAIPASHLQYGSADANAPGSFIDPDAAIAIRPMNKTDVISTHTLKIFQRDNSTTPVDVSPWTLTPRAQNVPEALWGKPPDPFTQIPDQPAAKVIPGKMVGYTVQAPAPHLGQSRGVVSLKVLLEEYLTPAGQAPLSTAVVESPAYVPAFDNQTIRQIEQIMSTPAKQSRDSLYAVLAQVGLYTGENGDLSQLAGAADHLYSDPPLQQTV